MPVPEAKPDNSAERVSNEGVHKLSEIAYIAFGVRLDQGIFKAKIQYSFCGRIFMKLKVG